MRVVNIGGQTDAQRLPKMCGGKYLLWILGPCVVESLDTTMRIAESLANMALTLNIAVVFKASFDKANRSSAQSFRGLGIDVGLDILHAVREKYHLPITTDVHDVSQVWKVGDVVDLIQIPALLSKQTDLLLAAAETGKPVNVKKGQFMGPRDAINIAAKVITQGGNQNLILTERGTTFGYGELVVDMRSIQRMRDMTECPVIFDATHSVQKPAGKGHASDGERVFAPILAKAAVAAGCDGLFLETHFDPDKALSDGPNSVPLTWLPNLVKQCQVIRSALAM